MNYHLLTSTQLFHGMHQDEIESVLEPLGAHEQTYQPGEVIVRTGDPLSEIGLIERGSADLVANFWWGDSHAIGHVGVGETFGQNFAAVPGYELMCDIVAVEETIVLFIEMDKVLHTCQNNCDVHRRLTQNILRISATRNLELSHRMVHVSPKTIRGRMLSYLSQLANEQESVHVIVPYSRQQLADYLIVDRSALSGELSKMQRDGLISYNRNAFTLLEVPEGS